MTIFLDTSEFTAAPATGKSTGIRLPEWFTEDRPSLRDPDNRYPRIGWNKTEKMLDVSDGVSWSLKEFPVSEEGGIKLPIWDAVEEEGLEPTASQRLLGFNASLDQIRFWNGSSWTNLLENLLVNKVPYDVNALDFEVFPSGSYDSAPGLQAALNAAVGKGNQVVYIPPGLYNVNYPLQQPVGVSVVSSPSHYLGKKCTIKSWLGFPKRRPLWSMLGGVCVNKNMKWEASKSIDIAPSCVIDMAPRIVPNWSGSYPRGVAMPNVNTHDDLVTSYVPTLTVASRHELSRLPGYNTGDMALLEHGGSTAETVWILDKRDDGSLADRIGTTCADGGRWVAAAGAVAVAKEDKIIYLYCMFVEWIDYYDFSEDEILGWYEPCFKISDLEPSPSIGYAQVVEEDWTVRKWNGVSWEIVVNLTNGGKFQQHDNYWMSFEDCSIVVSRQESDDMERQAGIMGGSTLYMQFDRTYINSQNGPSVQLCAHYQDNPLGHYYGCNMLALRDCTIGGLAPLLFDGMGIIENTSFEGIRKRGWAGAFNTFPVTILGSYKFQDSYYETKGASLDDLKVVEALPLPHERFLPRVGNRAFDVRLVASPGSLGHILRALFWDGKRWIDVHPRKTMSFDFSPSFRLHLTGAFQGDFQDLAAWQNDDGYGAEGNFAYLLDEKVFRDGLGNVKDDKPMFAGYYTFLSDFEGDSNKYTGQYYAFIGETEQYVRGGDSHVLASGAGNYYHIEMSFAPGPAWYNNVTEWTAGGKGSKGSFTYLKEMGALVSWEPVAQKYETLGYLSTHMCFAANYSTYGGQRLNIDGGQYFPNNNLRHWPPSKRNSLLHFNGVNRWTNCEPNDNVYATSDTPVEGLTMGNWIDVTGKGAQIARWGIIQPDGGHGRFESCCLSRENDIEQDMRLPQILGSIDHFKGSLTLKHCEIYRQFRGEMIGGWETQADFDQAVIDLGRTNDWVYGWVSEFAKYYQYNPESSSSYPTPRLNEIVDYQSKKVATSHPYHVDPRAGEDFFLSDPGATNPVLRIISEGDLAKLFFGRTLVLTSTSATPILVEKSKFALSSQGDIFLQNGDVLVLSCIQGASGYPVWSDVASIAQAIEMRNQGLFLPEYSAADLSSLSVTGKRIAWDTTNGKPVLWNGTSWVSLAIE